MIITFDNFYEQINFSGQAQCHLSIISIFRKSQTAFSIIFCFIAYFVISESIRIHFLKILVFLKKKLDL